MAEDSWYVVLLAVKDEASVSLNEDLQNRLKAMGLGAGQKKAGTEYCGL